MFVRKSNIHSDVWNRPSVIADICTSGTDAKTDLRQLAGTKFVLLRNSAQVKSSYKV